MSKLSIVIPACNCADSITRAVESVLEFAFDGAASGNTPSGGDLECILVVNNSTDNTLEVCLNIAGSHPEVKVINSDAGNVSMARNAGLEVATGDIIGFCDADDTVNGAALKSAYNQLITTGADMLISGVTRVDSVTGATQDFPIPNAPALKSSRDARCDIINHPSILGSVWNKLYRREILGGVTFDEGLTYCEDMDFNLRVLKKDLRVTYHDGIYYKYYNNGVSATTSVDRLYDENNKLKYLDAVEKIRAEYPDDKVIYKATGLKMATLCIDNYSDDLSDARQTLLATYIRRNLKFLVRYVYKYEPAVNRMRLRKALKILLKH